MVTLPKSNRNVFVFGPSNLSYTRKKCATTSQVARYIMRGEVGVPLLTVRPQVIGGPEDNVSLWQQMASKVHEWRCCARFQESWPENAAGAERGD
jgi:hypothetical protein